MALHTSRMSDHAISTFDNNFHGSPLQVVQLRWTQGIARRRCTHNTSPLVRAVTHVDTAQQVCDRNVISRHVFLRPVLWIAT